MRTLLYIDPGTGAMLFSIIIGVASALLFLFQKLKLKIKFLFTGGKIHTENGEKKAPYLIFAESRRYWNLFKPICDEFERRGVDVIYWTQSEDDPVFSESYAHVKPEFIGEGNKAFTRLNFASARIILATTPNLDVYQWKRSKNVDCYVHIYHACGKHILYRMFALDFFDAVLLTGELQKPYIRELERMRDLPEKELVKVGSPILDAMAARLEAEKSAEDKAEKKDPEDVNVLLAPSWGASSLLMKYKDELIDALIETGFSVTIRPHPQSYTSDKEELDRLMAKYPETDRLKWNRDNNNFDVLKRSDVMISDFSGVILDFTLIFDKPVLYNAGELDTSIYDAAWFDKEEAVELYKKLGLEITESDFPSLKEKIAGALTDKSLSDARREVRDLAWTNRGNAASAVVDYLTDKYNRLEAAASAKKGGAGKPEKKIKKHVKGN